MTNIFSEGGVVSIDLYIDLALALKLESLVIEACVRYAVLAHAVAASLAVSSGSDCAPRRTNLLLRLYTALAPDLSPAASFAPAGYDMCYQVLHIRRHRYRDLVN